MPYIKINPINISTKELSIICSCICTSVRLVHIPFYNPFAAPERQLRIPDSQLSQRHSKSKRFLRFHLHKIVLMPRGFCRRIHTDSPETLQMQWHRDQDNYAVHNCISLLHPKQYLFESNVMDRSCYFKYFFEILAIILV